MLYIILLKTLPETTFIKNISIKNTLKETLFLCFKLKDMLP